MDEDFEMSVVCVQACLFQSCWGVVQNRNSLNALFQDNLKVHFVRQLIFIPQPTLSGFRSGHLTSVRM